MTVAYLGSLSIGQAVPGALGAAVAGMAGINAALPDILGRLEALAAFAPQPISFGAQLSLAQQMVSSVSAGIALGIPVPSIAAQLAAIAALIADLLAAVSAIEGQLAIVVAFEALLGSAGIHAYAYSGQAASMGSELGSELSTGVPGGAPTDAANAIVLITTVPATWTAMSQVFKVTP